MAKDKQEEKELTQAVRTLCATLRAMAHKKAENYELEFLQRVRKEIDKEIETRQYVEDASASMISNEVKKVLDNGKTNDY